MQTNSSSYWDERYQEDNTPWDMKAPSPPLKNYIDSIENKNAAILIPGCGNAYEAGYLLEKGFTNVTVIDLASTVTAVIKKKYHDTSLKVITGNFFELEDSYDYILEQTFFCAIDPSLRKAYVAKCYELLKPGGKIAGVFFNKKMVDVEPPYVATTEEYIELFQKKFNINKLEPCTTSVQPRMGTELYFEFEKKD
ncbi:MAG: methyltransferase domain-containing protein [Ginsengibacter sp.]